jgi:hypothetical protein
MATATRREVRVCPVCSLPLTVVDTGEGKTIEYDINEWARLCHHPDAGSPLACPSLQPLAKSWLDEP